MITAPTNWNTLWADSSSSMELRFTVSEDAYLNPSIGSGSCKLSHNLYQSYGIGNACSARLAITLWDVDEIAEGMLECTLECRLVSADGGTTTPWVSQGTYYLDTVEYDALERTAKLTCYDAMALADIYLYEDGVASNNETWPKTAQQIVSQVCTRTGITAPDSMTGWGNIECDNVDYITCRQALQSIAACAGGNWTITKANKLALVPLKGFTGTQAAGSMSVSEIKQTSKTRSVGGLILKNGNETFERGTGALVIQAESYYANDTVAGAVYSSILNLQYAGLRAAGCYVTPLVELGDLLEVDDNAAKVFADSVSLVYDNGLWGSITAPLQDGVEQRIQRRDLYASTVDRLVSQTRLMQATIDSYSTGQYVSDLLSRINYQANRNGGYTYITEGGGIVTYDAPVTNPLVGAEALKMTVVKGGLVYIANRSSTSEAWQLQSVIQDGHVAANLVTSANITSGYIGSSTSGNYWNLDTGELRMSVGVDVGVVNLLMDTERADLNAHAAQRPRYVSDSANADVITMAFCNLSISDRPIIGVSVAAEFTMTGLVGKNKRGLCFYDRGSVSMVDHASYTISCYARSTLGSGGVQFQVGNGGYITSPAYKVSSSWKQYSWTFEYTDLATGGASGTRVYFMAVGNDEAGKVQLGGFKLERGTAATEYQRSVADISYDNEHALASAMLYANALNDSLDQEKMLKRLTNNGQARGIFYKDGQLYVNASYVKSGTIDAALIKAGLIQDALKLNSWNMVTGDLTTKNLSISAGNITGSLKMAQNPAATKNYIAVTPNGLDFIGDRGVGLRIRQASDSGREMIQVVDTKATGSYWNTALDIRSSVHTAGVLKQGMHSSGYSFSKDTPYSGYGLTTIVPIGFKRSLGSSSDYVTHHLVFVNGILVEVR